MTDLKVVEILISLEKNGDLLVLMTLPILKRTALNMIFKLFIIDAVSRIFCKYLMEQSENSLVDEMKLYRK